MQKKILITSIFLILLSPKNAFARDPYPYNPRLKLQLMPLIVKENPHTIPNPQSMLTQNGTYRSGLIAFSCAGLLNKPTNLRADDFYVDEAVYLSAKSVDNQSLAESLCQQRYNVSAQNVKIPFLKNNKTDGNCPNPNTPYDANCYNYPLGQDFLGSIMSPLGFMWTTPLIYTAGGNVPNLCGENHNTRCSDDCIYTPFGPSNDLSWHNELIDLTNNLGHHCVAPPYTTSGVWWNWLRQQIIDKKNSLSQEQYAGLVDVGIYLGIDGEGRPIKSSASLDPDTAWRPVNGSLNDLNAKFASYVSAVVGVVKDEFQGKVIRSHTDTEFLKTFLDRGVEPHRESLSSDHFYNYFYKGVDSFFGYWQGFANRFWVTNSQGLLPAWPPSYQLIFAALSMHTDIITGIPTVGLYDNGKGSMLKFANDYIGRDTRDTPGVWSFLRETDYPKERVMDDPRDRQDKGQNVSGKYGDYEFYLYRSEDLEGNKTVPVQASYVLGKNPEVKKQMYSWNEQPVFGTFQEDPRGYNYTRNITKDLYVGRKNNAPDNQYMSFDIDDGYAYRYAGNPGASYDVRIVYFGENPGQPSFDFEYKDRSGGNQTHSINRNNDNLWHEAKFTLDNAFFDNNMSSNQMYPADFRLKTNGTIIQVVEIRASPQISLTQDPRPKAQIRCDIREENGPEDGIFSVGLNRNLIIRARLLKDDNTTPIPNARIMSTYNSEWNLAKSAKTDSNGVAVSPLSTTNRADSSGFMGEEGDVHWKDSVYSVQTYFPGNNDYQPSRNDCTLHVTNSRSINDTNNRKLVITSIIPGNPRLTVKYKIIRPNSTQEGDIHTVQIGKAEGFYESDTNAQTIGISYTGEGYMAFNNFTVNGSGALIPSGAPSPTTSPNPVLNLKRGVNLITSFPHYNSPQRLRNLPTGCEKTSTRPNNFFKPHVNNFGGYTFLDGNKYYIFCSQDTTW